MADPTPDTPTPVEKMQAVSIPAEVIDDAAASSATDDGAGKWKERAP